ncbi:TerC family protein [Dokdonella immobilis]|uniref:Tellurite resistance protein TerC n=1 Tax=Dokdonella immobilis TaxID=578942 RepID=A0A1I4YPK8_9GAMM|nr:TerC family protein [Dokdonella immobilis]SFN39550.1 tellurite resistance protein TerC [Dokdonella immobilis]
MHTIGTPGLWSAFGLLVVVALIIDFVVLRAGGAHKVSYKEAALWSVAWIALAMLFNLGLWYWLDGHGGSQVADETALQFLTGYVVEKALAIDNIFVFLLIFTRFGVSPELQQRALMVGILGAIVLRAILIFIGAALIARYHWILYLFGAFLVYTGIKMIRAPNDEADFEANPLMRWMRGHLRLSNEYHGSALTVVKDGVRWFTPMFVVIALLAVTDVIFAVDSIPAIFAITEDPFIVLTSNVFAVLGLRALFFLIAGMAERFHLLNYGLAGVLTFIGLKMLIVDVWKVPIGLSLGMVALLIGGSLVASRLIPRPD